MTLIVDALNRIARECRFTPPNGWVASTDLAAVQVRDDFLRECIDEIVDRVDVPQPVAKQTVIAGTGVENYALPSDFRRLVRGSAAIYETTTTRRAGLPITNDGAWTHLKEIGTAGAFRYYRVKGYDGNYTIDFYREPSSSDSITVHYISNVWMATAGGTEGTTFTAEDDVLLLPRRLVELGTIYRFRMDKGMPYEPHQMQFEAHLSRLSVDGRQKKQFGFGDEAQPFNPLDIPVPDFIPSS